MRRTRTVIVTALVLLVLAPRASGETAGEAAGEAPGEAAGEACWAPDRAQAPDAAVARVAPVAALEKDVAAVAAVLKQSAALRRIPQARLGITSYIGHANPGYGHAVRVSAGLYPPNTWRAGCTLMKGPEFFNEGHVHVTFNEPREIFEHVRRVLDDDELTAYAEPSGPVTVGEETYHPGLRAVVLTPGRIPAWIPVTADELLRWRERAAQRRLDEATALLREHDRSLEAYRRDMRAQIDQAPDAAEKARLRRALDENVALLEKARPDLERQAAQLRRDPEAALAAARAERARLSAAQLAAPARHEGTALVKLNPALANRGGRVNLVVVRAFANDPARQEPLEAAVRDLDHARLRALLR